MLPAPTSIIVKPDFAPSPPGALITSLWNHCKVTIQKNTITIIKAPQSSDFFSGGGPQGWSIFSSIWNLTLALDSFSQIARWFVKSVWPIRLANVSLEKCHRGWFLVLKFDSHLCWWVAHSNLVVSAWPVPMYILGLQMLHLREDVEPACAVCSRHFDKWWKWLWNNQQTFLLF